MLDGVTFVSKLDWVWASLVIGLVQSVLLPVTLMLLRQMHAVVIYLGMMVVQAGALALAEWIVGGFEISGTNSWLLCWLTVGTVCSVPLVAIYVRGRR